MALRGETIKLDGTRVVKVSAWKSDRGQLVMHAQSGHEEQDGAFTVFRFMVFGDPATTVAREDCKRATKRVVEDFWNRNIERARQWARELPPETGEGHAPVEMGETKEAM